MNLKKILALVLVFAMCLSFVPTYAFADDDGIIEVVEEEPIVEVIDEPEEEPAPVIEEETPVTDVVEETPAEEPAPVEDEPAEEPEEETLEEELTLKDDDTFDAKMFFYVGALEDYDYYATLADALKSNPEKITFLQDYPAEGTAKNLTIAQDVTIEGRGEDKEATAPNAYYTGNITVNANVVFNHVNFVGNITVNGGSVIFTDCNINGTVTANAGTTLIQASTPTDLARVTGTITVSGGEVELKDVFAKDANPAINVTGTTGHISVDEEDTEGAYGVAVFTGTGAVKGFVKAGTFQRIDKVLLADGYVTAVYAENTKYGEGKVVKATPKDVEAVAMVDTGADRWYYATMTDAVEAAGSVGMITALKEGLAIELPLKIDDDHSISSVTVSSEGYGIDITTPNKRKAIKATANADGTTTYSVEDCVAYVATDTDSHKRFSSFAEAAGAAVLKQENNVVYFAESTAELDNDDVAYLTTGQVLKVAKGGVDCDANVRVAEGVTDANVVISAPDAGVTTYWVDAVVATITRDETTHRFHTLADAIVNAQAEDTIVLVNDTQSSGGTIDKNLTFDLGGKTLTLTSGITLAAGTPSVTRTLAVKHGTIDASSITVGSVFATNEYDQLVLDQGLTVNAKTTVIKASDTDLQIKDAAITVSETAASGIEATESGGGWNYAKFEFNGTLNYTGSGNAFTLNNTNGSIAGTINGKIYNRSRVTVADATITGDIVNGHILTVANATITGDIDNGETLTVENATITGDIINRDTLNIQNGTINGDVSESSSDAKIIIGGEAENNNPAITGGIYATATNTDLTIKSGTVNGNILVTGTDTDLTIEGGTITGNIDLQNKAQGVLFAGTVNGAVTLSDADTKFTMSNGTIENADAAAAINVKNGAALEITGGTVKSETAIQVDPEDYDQILVSGGTFDERISLDFCAEGCGPVENDDHTFTVMKVTPIAYLYTATPTDHDRRGYFTENNDTPAAALADAVATNSDMAKTLSLVSGEWTYTFTAEKAPEILRIAAGTVTFTAVAEKNTAGNELVKIDPATSNGVTTYTSAAYAGAVHTATAVKGYKSTNNVVRDGFLKATNYVELYAAPAEDFVYDGTKLALGATIKVAHNDDMALTAANFKVADKFYIKAGTDTVDGVACDTFTVADKVFELVKNEEISYFDKLDDLLAVLAFDGDEYVTVLQGVNTISLKTGLDSALNAKVAEKPIATPSDLTVKAADNFVLSKGETDANGFVHYTQIAAKASVKSPNGTFYYASFKQAAGVADKKTDYSVTAILADDAVYTLATDSDLTVKGSTALYKVAAPTGYKLVETQINDDTINYTAVMEVSSVTYQKDGAEVTEYGDFKVIADKAWQHRDEENIVVTIYVQPGEEDVFTIPTVEGKDDIYQTGTLNLTGGNGLKIGKFADSLIVFPAKVDENGSATRNAGRFTYDRKVVSPVISYTVKDAIAETRDKGGYYHYFDSVDAAWNSINSVHTDWYGEGYSPVLLNPETVVLASPTDTFTVTVGEGVDTTGMVTYKDNTMYVTTNASTEYPGATVWSVLDYVARIYEKSYTIKQNNNGSYTVSFEVEKDVSPENGYESIADLKEAYAEFVENAPANTFYYINFVAQAPDTFDLATSEVVIYKDSANVPVFETVEGLTPDQGALTVEILGIEEEPITGTTLPDLKVISTAAASTVTFVVDEAAPNTARFYVEGYTTPWIGHGYGDAYTVTAKNGTAIKLPTSPRIDVPGYVFDAWYAESAPETPIATEDLPVTYTANEKFTAKWVEQVYDIRYSTEGVNAKGEPIADVKVPNGSTYKVSSENVTIENASKVGYTFTGWNITIDGTAAAGFKPSTETPNYIIKSGSTGSYVFTPVLEKTKYAVDGSTYFDDLSKALEGYEYTADHRIENINGATDATITLNSTEQVLVAKGFTVKADGAFTMSQTTLDNGFTQYTLADAVASLTSPNGTWYYTSFASAAAYGITDSASTTTYVTALQKDEAPYTLAAGKFLTVKGDAANYKIEPEKPYYFLNKTESADSVNYFLTKYVASVNVLDEAGNESTTYGKTFAEIAQLAWNNRDVNGVAPTVTLYSVPAADAKDVFEFPHSGVVYELGTLTVKLFDGVTLNDYSSLVKLPAAAKPEGSQTENEGRYFGTATAKDGTYTYKVEDAVAYTQDKGEFYHYFMTVDEAWAEINTTHKDWYETGDAPILLKAVAVELTEAKPTFTVIVPDGVDMNNKVTTKVANKYATSKASATYKHGDLVATEWSLIDYVARIYKDTFTATRINDGTYTITFANEPELVSEHDSIAKVKAAYDELVAAGIPENTFYYIEFIATSTENYLLGAEETVVFKAGNEPKFADPSDALQAITTNATAADLNVKVTPSAATVVPAYKVVSAKNAATVTFTIDANAPAGARFLANGFWYDLDNAYGHKEPYTLKTTVGSTIAVPTGVNVTAAGYDFDGWYAASAPTVKIATADLPTEVTADETYTAKWVAHEYKITYNMGAEDESIVNPNAEKTSFKVTDTAYKFDDPTRYGYTFAGWTVSGGVTVATATKDYELPAGTVGDVTLTATWVNVKYTLDFDYGVGEAPKGQKTGYWISDKDVTILNPEKVGYTFLGWAIEKDGVAQNDWTATEAEPNFIIKSGSSSNYKFTARWESIPYSITYYIEGVDSVDPAQPYAEIEFKLADVAQEPIDVEKPAFAGYSFDKYTLTIDKATVTDIPEKIGPDAEPGDYVFHIYYDKNQWTLTINSVEHASSVATTTTLSYMDKIEVATTTDAHYQITGWHYEQLDIDYTPEEMATMTMADNNMAFTPIVEPVEYTITLKLPETVTVGDNTYNVLYAGTEYPMEIKYTVESIDVVLPNAEAVEAVVDGYTFSGWLDGTEVVENFVPATVAGDVTYTASLAPVTYSVEFYDGTSLISSTEAIRGQSVSSIVTANNIANTVNTLINRNSETKTLYDGEWWYVTNDAGEKQIVASDAVVTADTDYRLNWYPYYELTFFEEDGLTKIGQRVTYLTEKDTFGSVKQPTIDTTKPGQHIVWLENGEEIAEDAKIDHDVNAVLSWADDVYYTVTFMSDGKEVHSDSVLENTTVEPYEIEKESAEFLGWFLNETDEESFDFATLIATNTTLTAKWEEVDFSTYAKGTYSLALTDSFSINFYVSNLMEGTDPAEYTIWVDGEELGHMTNMTRNGFPAIATFNAKMMTSEVEVTVKYKSQTVLIEKASVKGYCEKVLSQYGKNTAITEQLYNLAKAVLNYGSAAQQYMNPNTPAAELANGGEYFDEPAKAVEMATENKSELIKGVTKATSSVNMSSVLEMNLYVTLESGAKVADYTFKLDGTEVAQENLIDKGSNKYGVVVTGIAAKKFAVNHTLEVVYHEGQEDEATFSYTTTPLAYLYKASVSGNAALEKISFYLYNYYAAAIAYA